MFRRTSLIALLSLGAAALADQPLVRDTQLLEAVKQKESGGRADVEDGDGGLAVGILQIHPVMVEDVNRISGLRFTLEDRRDVAKSEQMFWIYADHYSKGASREVIARRWNGGPTGHRKASTLGYWRDVRRRL